MSGSDRPPDDLEERWPVEWDEAASPGATPRAPRAAGPGDDDPEEPDPLPEEWPAEEPAPASSSQRPASTWTGAAPDEPPAPPPAPSRFRVPFARAGAGVPLAILGLALLTRLFRLGSPDEIIPLDETHYVADAKDVLRLGSEDHFVVHPPVGKWFIAAGMRIFGRNSAFGWRFFGAVLGAAGILLLYLIARRLWRSKRTAILAAFLLGIEGLWFVQSRVAMLDIYAAFFVLLAFWLLLEDRARTEPDHRGIRWWRLGAGLAVGGAMASKWGSAPIVPMLGLLALVWEWRRLRGREDFRRAFVLHAARIGAVLVLVPGLVYAATYAPWAVRSDRYEPPRCRDRGTVSAFLCYQGEIYRFHQTLQEFDDKGEVKHPYFSKAWSWPYIGRPVAHYYKAEGTGDAQRDRQILGLPNPAIWWTGFIAILPLAWWAVRRRDAVAATILLGIGVFWLPYLVAGLGGRPNFMFYATPLAPFIVLAVVHLLHRLWALQGAGALVFAYVMIAAMLFLYFYPVLSGVEIPHEGTFGWRSRIWFAQDCTIEGIKSLCWI